MTAEPWELVTGYLTGEIQPVKHGPFLLERVSGRAVPTEIVPGEDTSRFNYPITPLTYAPVRVDQDLTALGGSAHLAELAFLSGMTQERTSDLMPLMLAEVVESMAPELDEAREAIFALLERMPLVGQLNFSQEQFRIYAFWLRAMNTLELPESLEVLATRIAIILDLREWVMNHELARDSQCLLPLVTNPDLIEPLIEKYDLIPSALLQRLGLALEFGKITVKHTDGG